MENVQRETGSEKPENLGEKLRIVLLCSEWGSSKGGLPTFNRQLAIYLGKRSDLQVFCYLPEVSDRDKNAAKERNVILVEAEDIPGNRDPLVKLLRWPSQRPSPDVIISHGQRFGPAAFFIKDRNPSCKWVHFVHVNYEEMGKYKVGNNEIRTNNQKDLDEMSCCKSADVVVAVGPQLLDRYSRRLSIEQKKVQVFYPGLSKEFQNLPQKEFERREFHVYIFCRCSSEDFELKGVDLVADAVGKLGKNYKLHVVGVQRNEEEIFLKNIIETTEATKNQLFLREYCNNQEEMRRMKYEADLVAMPSRAEAFGLIGLEALSVGVPLLVSAASGLGMTFKKLEFGNNFVVESDDSEEWARRIESMKQKGISLRTNEIEVMRRLYDEKYKWDGQCKKLIKLFRDVRKDGKAKGTTQHEIADLYKGTTN